MIIENLDTPDLVRIANRFAIDNWGFWRDVKWNGYDLVGNNYIFQLSWEGTIRIYTKETVVEVPLEYDQEDELRKVLNEILRNGK